MGVPAVAGVDDVAAEVARSDGRGAGAMVAHDQARRSRARRGCGPCRRSVSPLTIDDERGSSTNVSAPKRRAASSNDRRVRVDGSGEQERDVVAAQACSECRARRVVDDLARPDPGSRSTSARSSSLDVDQVTPIPGHAASPGSLAALDDHLILATVDLGQVDLDHLVARRRHVLAHVIGADGQLAVAAIDEHGQSNGLADGRRRPAHRARRGRCGRCRGRRRRSPACSIRAERAAPCRAQLGRSCDLRQVVAVEGDVEAADRWPDALVGSRSKPPDAPRAALPGARCRPVPGRPCRRAFRRSRG